MKCIIPLGGYATRLFPLTKNFPKALLEINQKPILEHIIKKVITLGINEIFLVSNDKYYTHFAERTNRFIETHSSVHIHLYNDHTVSNEDRLGAIGDIHYAIKQGNINDDVLILCGDNMFDFWLEDSFELFQKVYQPTVIGYDVKTKNNAKRFGVVEIDPNAKEVISFQEKPQEPKSTTISIGVYYYPKNILPLFAKYLEDGKKVQNETLRKKWPDAPWNFPARLLSTGHTVYAQTHDEPRFDVGTKESLKDAREYFSNKN